MASGTDAGATRMTRRRVETRRRLIDAAYEVFAEVGIRDAPVELICEHAGFTRGAFYSNFASKEELFLAVYREQTATRVRRLRAAVEHAVDAVDPDAPDAPDASTAIIQRAGLAFMNSLASDKTWHLLCTEFFAQALRQRELHAPVAAAKTVFHDALAEILQYMLEHTGLRLAVEPHSAVLTVVKLYETMLDNAILDELPDTADSRYVTDVLPRLFAALLVPSND